MERQPDGALRACDPHGCVEVSAKPEVKVVVVPLPAGRRLLRVSHVYVEFERPVYAEPGDTVWFYAPVELEVRVGRVPVATLATSRVKYTLIGDVIDGIICRHHGSPASLGGPPGEPPPGTALAAVRVTGEPGVHGGAGLVSDSRLYRDDSGNIYYEMHEVSVDSGLASVKARGEPPRPALKLVWRPATRPLRLAQVEQLSYRLG